MLALAVNGSSAKEISADEDVVTFIQNLMVFSLCDAYVCEFGTLHPVAWGCHSNGEQAFKNNID